MNTNGFLLSVAPLAALTLLLQPQAPAGRKLERIPADTSAPEREAPGSGQRFEVKDWKKRLADPDLAQRERAYAELVERARNDRTARQALEDWSRASDASELAWTSRLALRELERGGPAAGRARGGDTNELRSRLDQLERHFGGMDSMFEDLRSQMDHMAPGEPQDPGTFRGWSGLRTPFAGPGGTQPFQSYQLRVGPDGVTLETTEKVDGKEQKKTYKAKDMEELLANHPELGDKLGGGLQFQFHTFGLPGFPGPNGGSIFGDDAGADGWLHPARPSSAPPTEVLGIYSEKLTPDQAQELGLEPEQGLRVERIEPGTIAQILGIRRGDTLVELNGKPIYSRDDVKRILKERAQDGDVVVTILGEGSKERRTLRWTPSEPQQPGTEKPKKL